MRKGRKKTIAPETELIGFHVGVEHKKFLQDYANDNDQGVSLSDLVRRAVNNYIEKLRQDAEIQKLRTRPGFGDVFLKYDKATEKFSKTGDFSLLDEFISTVRKEHEKELSSQGKTPSELLMALRDLKSAVAYQYLIFAIRLTTWKRQLITSLSYMPWSESELMELHKKLPPIKKESRPLLGETEAIPKKEDIEKVEWIEDE